MPDLLVVVHQISDIATANHLYSANAIAFVDSALFKIVSQREDLHALFTQSVDVFVWLRGMINANVPNLQRRAFLLHQVIHGVATQQHIDIGATILQGATEPKARVILLFEGGTI